MFKKLTELNKRFKLPFIVFCSGAIVMILEITGSRLVAPYFGNSIFIWTSLIGVILGSLSLGYHLGGKQSDKKASIERLSRIILYAAIGVGVITVIHQSVFFAFDGLNLDFRIEALFATIIVFAVPSVFLGMVSPYAVRLSLEDIKSSGETVGNLYAVSTLGSILGTFAAGFILIPLIGSLQLMIILTLALFLLSAFVKFSKAILVIIVSAIIATVIIDPFYTSASTLIDTDTQYQRVQIFERERDGKTLRGLSTSKRGIQSGFYLEEPNELAFNYLKAFNLWQHYNPEATKVLVVGGGAYTYPMHLIQENPNIEVDVVEIDPELVKLAEEYFNYIPDPRINVIHQDARIFINNSDSKYDVILLDAFNSSDHIPFHLTTIETMNKVRFMLSEGGVVVANMITPILGSESKFFNAELNTFKKAFDDVFVFQVTETRLDERQNIIFVASKGELTNTTTSNNPAIQEFLDRKWNGTPDESIPVLTDNFAPVENYILSTFE